MHCTNVGNLMQIRCGFDALSPKVRFAPQVLSFRLPPIFPKADIVGPI